MRTANSLRSQLWFSLLGLMAVVGLTTAAFSYWYTRAEMESLLDLQLRQFAINIQHTGSAPRPAPGEPLPHDPEDELLIQVWDAAGRPIRPAPPGNEVPRQTTSGFADTATDKGQWRTYAVVADKETVQVSQQKVVRSELAQNAALRALIPIGVMVPLTWLLLGFILSRVLGGLDTLIYRLASTASVTNSAIPDREVPAEIRPMVGAMSDLLGRLQRALETQKRFVADAAHELRTPLAALQIQAANLRATHGPEAREDRIEDLERGIRRAANLVDQLLKTAKAEAGSAGIDPLPIELTDLVKSAVARLLPIVDHRGQDIGLVHADAITIMGDPADLGVLVANLLENAVRYSPPGGTIDVRVDAGTDGPRIEIADSGPGIEPDLLGRVFEPFYRAGSATEEGSGLGLAIVARVAERHHLKVALINRTDRPGLIARVEFPRSNIVTAS